ncbi:DNA-binding protein [Massilia sp. TWR1-2-2]|uniref:DNA-binding protein n=1 Tax=Massilia sp. TWR1-2-2 TaxID=2804584 RepID=UPI003CFA2685
MARAGVVYSQVAKAAAKLAVEGKNPTVDNVREALGGTGSKSTIAPMLKRWKSAHQKTIAEAELGLPAELVRAVKDIYEKLQADLAHQLGLARESHRQEQEAMAERLKLAAADMGALTETKDRLAQKLARLKASFERLQKDQHAGEMSLTAARADNAGLQQRLADRRAEVQSLTQQLTQTRVQFEHYQETTARQRTEDRQAFEQRIARLELDLASGQQRQAAQQATLAQQETKLSQLDADNARLRRTAQGAQAAQGAVKSERDQLTYQVKELSAARVDLDNRLKMAQQALTEANMIGAAAQKQAEMLTHQLASVEAKAEKADQERLGLIQKLTEREHGSTQTDSSVAHKINQL